MRRVFLEGQDAGGAGAAAPADAAPRASATVLPLFAAAASAQPAPAAASTSEPDPLDALVSGLPDFAASADDDATAAPPSAASPPAEAVSADWRSEVEALRSELAAMRSERATQAPNEHAEEEPPEVSFYRKQIEPEVRAAREAATAAQKEVANLRKQSEKRETAARRASSEAWLYDQTAAMVAADAQLPAHVHRDAVRLAAQSAIRAYRAGEITTEAAGKAFIARDLQERLALVKPIIAAARDRQTAVRDAAKAHTPTLGGAAAPPAKPFKQLLFERFGDQPTRDQIDALERELALEETG